MFLDSLAYDVATELAEGGPGGKPQFRTVSIKKSLENAGNKAFGEFLGWYSFVFPESILYYMSISIKISGLISMFIPVSKIPLTKIKFDPDL